MFQKMADIKRIEYDIDRLIWEIAGRDSKVSQEVAASMQDIVASAVDELPLRDRIIIQGYFGKERQTLAKISRQFSVSRNRVWQIKEKAVRKLRHPSRLKFLLDPLDQS